MIVLIFTSILIINWAPVSSSVPDFKCHVTNYTVHLQITLNTTIVNDTTVVLKTRNIHTNKMKTYQCVVGGDRRVARCAVWRGEDEATIISNYYYSTYQVTVMAERNSTVYWSRIVGELGDFLYDCFEDHKIENLKITCGDCVRKSHVASTGKDAQCRHLQWQRQIRDVGYELISKHSINIGDREVTNKVGCDPSRTLCIYNNLHNLDECNPEEVCVNTHFKPDYHGLQRPKLQQCISTSTMCNRNKCKRNSASDLRLVVSITLSTAGLIMAVLAGAMLHRKYKRGQPSGESPAEEDDGGVVMPRGFADGLGKDGLYPRNDHDYAYPNFVIPDMEHTEIVPFKDACIND